VNLYAISMQSEPDENVDYESCLWTGAQMDSLVASLAAKGATNPLTAKLLMPESAVFNTSYSDPTLADSSAVGNVSIVGGHLYVNGESQGSPFFYTNAENAGNDVWMTERYLTPVSGNTPTITVRRTEAVQPFGCLDHSRMPLEHS
jgi:glucuronoarabinoxylan endo-1,4-beta-xylanase